MTTTDQYLAAILDELRGLRSERRAQLIQEPAGGIVDITLGGHVARVDRRTAHITEPAPAPTQDERTGQ